MKPELLAPVGDFSMLQAAMNAGADAVYFGLKVLNMRSMGSSNFSFEELPKLVSLCHENKIRAYMTLNTIIYPGEESLVDEALAKAKQARVDAIIAWDLMVLQKAIKLGLEVHLSTQASVANFEALKFYHNIGVKRFVLARELDLDQIKNIKKQIMDDKLDAKIETFIHGAMCIAVSGRCFMSQIAACKSANRGECIQVCRRKYKITDVEEGTELELENQYVMSPKDLCTMPIIDKIIDAGIDVFKIEGRARAPEYVKVVVECYRQAIDAHKKGELSEALKKEFISKMEKVYNRGFETGFYQGKPMDAWAGTYGSKATTRKVYLGTLSNYYNKTGVAEVKIESEYIEKGDKYYVIGPTTGVIENEMPDIMVDDNIANNAKKGQIITFKAPKCRAGDKFYKIVKTTDDLVQK
ncbi:U32 family peptidase [archaeon]|nr:U32 family peptidase [archaeon]MBL7057022.1 U32 family peptidase [Candidatus Woesearchaeota archaeon]